MAGSREIRAGKAYIELSVKDKMIAGLKAAQKRLNAFGTAVTAVGKKLLAVGLAATAALTAAIVPFMKMGDQLDKMSQRTGASVEWLSQMKFAAQQSGASIEDLETALRGMNKGFGDATRGQGEFLKGLNLVGISMSELENLNTEERFERLAAAVDAIQDPAVKARTAMQLFSESGAKLLPMLGSVRELRDEAAALGLTMSGESATAAAKLTDAWGRLTSVFKTFLFEVGAALAPALTDIAGKVKDVASAVLKWVKDNRETVVMVAKVAVGVATAGAALLAFGVIIKIVAGIIGGLITVLSVLGTVIGFLTSPIGLVLAAVTGLTVYVLSATGKMGEAVGWFGEQWDSLKGYVAETMGGIKDAIEAGDIALAFRILWLSIKEIWLKGTQPLRELWIGLKSIMTDAWTDVVYGLLAGWDAAGYGLQVGWHAFTNFFGNAWSAVVGGVMKIWNSAIGGIAKAWIRLKGLFSDSVDVDAAIRYIDEETAAKNSSIDSEYEAQKQEQADAASARQRDREADKAALNEAWDAEKQANLDYYAGEMQGITDALADVRKERQALLAEARAGAEKARSPKAQEAQSRRGEVESAVAETKGSTLSSFYADQIAGMQYSSDGKRAADGIERLVVLTEDQNKTIKKNYRSGNGTLTFT